MCRSLSADFPAQLVITAARLAGARKFGGFPQPAAAFQPQ
jgi:hypothetical protein